MAPGDPVADRPAVESVADGALAMPRCDRQAGHGPLPAELPVRRRRCRGPGPQHPRPRPADTAPAAPGRRRSLRSGRWRAAQLAGLIEVTAAIDISLGEVERLSAQIAQNVDRLELTQLERVAGDPAAPRARSQRRGSRPAHGCRAGADRAAPSHGRPARRGEAPHRRGSPEPRGRRRARAAR
jgi:hypothetical protein